SCWSPGTLPGCGRGGPVPQRHSALHKLRRSLNGGRRRPLRGEIPPGSREPT
ncbi:GIP, partial [Symbiodinium sp. KB8]